MKINVKVVANAKKNSIKEENGCLKIYLTAPAVEGKANKALIDFLAVHFVVKKGQIEIIKGLKSKNKTVNISGYLE